MIYSRLFSRTRFLLLSSVLFSLAACSTATGTQNDVPINNTSTSTATVTSTPTPAPPQCDERYSSAYQATLPDSTYKETSVYAQVPLPPQTRAFSDDANGNRFRFMCSAGTIDAVLAFMNQHLTQLGWQQTGINDANPCEVVPNYGHPQCWKNGQYQLFLGINSNTDWVIGYLDPAFLP